jgi:hypothetical protein
LSRFEADGAAVAFGAIVDRLLNCFGRIGDAVSGCLDLDDTPGFQVAPRTHILHPPGEVIRVLPVGAL